MVSSKRRLTIVIPVHNEARIVEESVKRLASYTVLKAFEFVNLIFVENGSSDNSGAVVEKLNSSILWPASRGWIRGLSSSSAGIGHAYVKGSREALNRGANSANDWILWSACDIPFGSSDIESFLQLLDRDESALIVIGSKGHAQSRVKRALKRSLITLLFRLLRGLLIGMSVKDTQGTFFVRGDVLPQLFERPVARDFFYTTEFCFYALREDIPILEVPIVLSPETRPSTVRPIRDGYRMLRGLFRLRIMRTRCFARAFLKVIGN